MALLYHVIHCKSIHFANYFFVCYNYIVGVIIMENYVKEKSTVQISLRITPSLKKYLVQLSKEECRSLSNTIITILQSYIEDMEKAKYILKKRRI